MYSLIRHSSLSGCGPQAAARTLFAKCLKVGRGTRRATNIECRWQTSWLRSAVQMRNLRCVDPGPKLPWLTSVFNRLAIPCSPYDFLAALLPRSDSGRRGLELMCIGGCRLVERVVLLCRRIVKRLVLVGRDVQPRAEIVQVISEVGACSLQYDKDPVADSSASCLARMARRDLRTPHRRQ